MSSSNKSKPAATASSTQREPLGTGTGTASASAPTVPFHGDGLQYLSGFGNALESECLPGALPRGRNNPRQVPYNLYTEQLSGTAFTAPRRENRRTWLYRIQPSVSGVGLAEPVSSASSSPNSNSRYPTHFGGVAPEQCRAEINPLRWNPLPDDTGVVEEEEGLGVVEKDADAPAPGNNDLDFIAGMHLVCQAGDPAMKSGLAIYMYAFQSSMNQSSRNTSMNNTDGEFLIVPERGRLEIVTEVGIMTVGPTEIAVVPRGLVFQVNLLEHDNEDTSPTPTTTTTARGYLLEVYNATGFQLPELGPIGSNGLANARDFLHPVACCVSDQTNYRQPHMIITKSSSQLFTKTMDHSPYNVVAWHGNYLPYKYDLKRFCAVGSVSYDHLDPSIYTVLTCPTDQAGTALADFVIFPPRILATDSNTLRPPWFHRNTMSEFMGLIEGSYDAKQGFVKGGASLHNCMTSHGPDHASYVQAVNDPCEETVQLQGTLAFMFETVLPLKVAPAALEDVRWRDADYATCWDGLADQFSGWHLLADGAAAAVNTKGDDE
jgi:homogentisate 1,2-dioxygenase